MTRRRWVLLGVLALATAAIVVVAIGVSSGARDNARSATRPAVRANSAVGARRTGRGASATGAAAASGGGRPAEVSRLISLGRPIYCAGRRGDEVALTFD